MKATKLILSIAAVAMFTVAASADVLINEFKPNPPGTDPATQDIELLGTPTADFEGWFLSIECDNVTNKGVVDAAVQVIGTFDPNGYLVFTIPDLENPSFTVALLDSFTGGVGTDIDTNDDGVADDLSTFGTVYDALGSPDQPEDEALLYGAQLGGTDMAAIGTVEPELVFRDGTTLDWYAVTYHPGVWDVTGAALNPAWFDMDPTVPTFGSVNPSIPEPATLALLGFAGLAVLRRRR